MEQSQAFNLLLGKKEKLIIKSKEEIALEKISNIDDVFSKANIMQLKIEEPKLILTYLQDNSPVDFEYKKYMDKSLGKKREEMPQIDPKDLDSFLIHFSSVTKVKKITKPLNKLKPTQDDINEDKVLELIKNKANWKERIYPISLDGYLIDGHHSYAQGLEFDPDYEVTCYRINLPIKNILFRANKLKITTNKDINDKKV